MGALLPPSTRKGNGCPAGINSNHTTAAGTGALPYREAVQLPGAASQSDLLVLLTGQQFLSKQTHQTLNGVFESKSPI